MFSPHLKWDWSLFLLLFGVFTVTAPIWGYLKLLGLVIKQSRTREMALRVGRPTEVPHLDAGALEQATAELLALGFEQTGDYVTFSSETARAQKHEAPIASPTDVDDVPPDTAQTSSFMRVFTHERERCVGKVMASTVIPKDGRPAQTVFVRAIMSFADAPDGGEIWAYGTSDIKTDDTAAALSALWRQSRYLGTRLPKAPLPELLRVHLARRAQIADIAGFAWNRAPLRDSMESETRAMQNIRACFEQMTPLKMWWLMKRYKRQKNKTEWLGELRGKLPPLAL